MEAIVNFIRDLGKDDFIDYIQLLVTAIGIIISALAVYYAVKVPKTIAKEQNKIALFEKRFETYTELNKTFYYRVVTEVALGNYILKKETQRPYMDESEWYKEFRLKKSVLQKASFLFNKPISEKLNEIIVLLENYYDNEIVLGEGIDNLTESDFDEYTKLRIDLTEWKKDTVSELEKISNRYPSMIATYKNKKKEYNIYSLDMKQLQVAKQISNMLDEVFDEIAFEMSVYN